MSYCIPVTDLPTLELLVDVMACDHPELTDAAVRVGLLWAYADESDEYALMLRGVPAAAIVKLNPWLNRLQGMPDATIRIDAAGWKDADDDCRRALLSHELTHLELARDGEGAIKPDKAGRPTLNMRVHDYEIGIFRSVIERYGRASLDALHVKRIAEDFDQLLFDWVAATVPPVW